MRKNLLALLVLLLVASLVLIGGKTAPPTEPPPAEVKTEAPAEVETEAPAEGAKEVKKIAFFVSDMTNVFHQGQATEAQRYAKEKYGVDVYIFDGKSDSATMRANIDQVGIGGIHDGVHREPGDVS